MVQHPLPNHSRDFYKENGHWQPGDEGRFVPPQQPAHPRVLPVETALKDCAGLSVREFALFVVDEHGEEKTYSSASLAQFQQRIFNDKFRTDFGRVVQRVNRGSHPQFGHVEFATRGEGRHPFSGAEGRSRWLDSHSENSDGDDSSSGAGKRKRLKGTHVMKTEDNPVQIPTTKTMALSIGDEAEVRQFYCQRFKDMQQSACKVMGKAFVKAVEPKKQTHHPYTKGDIHAPSWWPLHGNHDEKVRHKEPDHLLKPERIALLVHILRMVVEPAHRQHPSVQKVGLNIKKLEDAAMEMMAPWFSEREHPENMAKKPFFKEIFRVARQEESYRNGEIDATTRIHVLCGDQNAINSDDEDDGDEGVQDDDAEHEITPSSTAEVSPTMAPPPLIQTQQPLPLSGSGRGFMRDRVIPLRHYTEPQLEDHNPYPDAQFIPRTLGVGFQSMSPVSGLHEATRRSFQSPGYHSPQQQQNMYGWSHPHPNMASQAPSGYYPTSPQSTLPPHSAAFQLPPPAPLVQQHHLLPGLPLPHPYDLSNTRGFDSAPALGNQLRTGSLGHPNQIPQHHGFPDYMDNVGHGQQEPDMKGDLYSA